ncbi:MAG: hypothetical protein LBT81_02165 [Helicobacteraceae bacterium]|jgi:ech hydrogenase subunit A|nr:hypothetical protein [Helicobacteraceae bacterium]
MDTAFYVMTHLPIAAALLLPWLPRSLLSPLLGFFTAAAAAAALYAVLNYAGPFNLTLPHWIDPVFTGADFALLVFFVYAGIRSKSALVWGIAALQIVLLAYVEFSGHSFGAYPEITVDRLTLAMWLLISFVGGAIAFYSITYMDYERSSERKKTAFSAILLGFIGVMNLLVAADSIPVFFLLFELTTLASFILIGWRGDETAVSNSIRALWMNQIGGAALLAGMITLLFAGKPLFFSPLIGAGDIGGGVLAAFSLMSAAALVKGAQMPFDRWLLGAMVAPTPVSAILHSSTMVKIAPFMILKFAPLIAGTYLAVTLSYFGGFVFVTAAALALGRKVFKEILAYSTISLLGLMILLASVGTPLSIAAAIAILLFHGATKAMLFMEAGVIEKLFYMKRITEMGGLIVRAPMSVFLILFGFASVTLPPFGALVGKWIAIEASVSGKFAFLFIVLGSVVITLLYFKAVCFLLGKSGSEVGLRVEKQPFVFSRINGLIGFVLVATALFIAPFLVIMISPIASELTSSPTGMALDGLSLVLPFGRLEFWQIASCWLLFVALPLLAFRTIGRADRAMEYSGGERLNMPSVTFFFSPNLGIMRVLTVVSFLFLVVTIVSGAFV